MERKRKSFVPSSAIFTEISRTKSVRRLCVCAVCDTAEKFTNSPEVSFSALRLFYHILCECVCALCAHWPRAPEMRTAFSHRVCFEYMRPVIHVPLRACTVERCLPIQRILECMHNGLDGKARETETEMSKFIEYKHHT